MKVIAVKWIVSGALLALIGCREDKQSEIVQSVGRYKSTDVEHTATVARCRFSSGKHIASSDCTNTTQAENELVLDKQNYMKHKPINESSVMWSFLQ